MLWLWFANMQHTRLVDTPSGIPSSSITTVSWPLLFSGMKAITAPVKSAYPGSVRALLCCSSTRKQIVRHIPRNDGHMDPQKVGSMRDAATPMDFLVVRSFLCLSGYYWRFIRDFTSFVAPLHALTSSQSQFAWENQYQTALNKLKFHLCSDLVRAFADFKKPFTTGTDVSSLAVGTVFSRKIEGYMHQVHYAIRTLNQAKKRYSTCEREALAVIFALKRFRLYLWSGNPFDLVTNHQRLPYAFAKRDFHGCLPLWINHLA